MASQINVDPPKINFGFDERFIRVASLTLPANQLFAHVTTSAESEGNFEKAGITISTNRGQPISAAMSKYVYFGDVADIRAATGGSKPFKDYTMDDCRRIVANITARYGGKLIFACDEAQENEGFWQWHDELATQAIEYYHMAWKEYKDTHPEFMGYYGPYSGSVNPVTFQSSDSIRQALSSPEAAFNFLSRRELEFYKCHYWSQKQYRYRAPLINMYIHQMASKHQVMAEIVIAVRLHQLALQWVGRDPNDFCGFFWTDTASGMNGSYTERHVRPVKGGTLFGHTFPGWCAENMVQISRYVFEHGRVGFNWLDTYLSGTNTSVVPPKVVRDEDGFVMSDCDSTQVSRTASFSNPSPFRPATTTYPCTPVPHGGQDMGALGAWWKCQARAVVDLEPQPMAWRQNGEAFIATDWPTYFVRTWTEKLAWVEGAVLGNVAVVRIYDLRGRFCVKGRGTMDFLINGKVYTVKYLRGVHNQIIIPL